MQTGKHEYDQGRLKSHLVNRGGEILVVVFSQVRVPDGKFGLNRLFARTRHSCLLLNDLVNGWYIDLDRHIDHAVQTATIEAEPNRVVYYGSSMGGYGALTTGLRRRDGTIYAFGPELELGRPGSQSAEHIAAASTLAVGLEALPMPHPVHCFFGVCDPVDALNAAVAFDRLPHAKHHLVWSSHANHDHLYSLNIIRRLIMTFNRPPEIELASKNLLADVPVKSLEQFGLTAEQLMSGNQVSVSGLRALPCFEQNPGMIWLAAKISEVQGDLQTALSWIEKAEDLIAHSNVLSTLPKRWRKQLPLHRIRLLCQLGRTYDACDLMIQTSKVFPVDRAMKDLGETLGLNLELSTDQPAP